MPIRIEQYEDLEFEIPSGPNEWVSITVPPMDCWTPAVVDEINKKLAKLTKKEEDAAAKAEAAGKPAPALDPLDPNRNPVELNRFLLKHFNPDPAQVAAIEKLVPRALNAIAKEWESASEIDSGKSDDSTESSTKTEQ
ncbi:hypothetical protein [Corynebacterium flavescens]|uniref:hypothetical protein n=1 Tax=Corynebacterium flavescens TaxID=28028 RepID=UPI0026473FC5|nr:hypothetical protein [Corynebacterium flavescens]MDN6199374.1 hypothetical protein [Corynebacterium flavescens]MDN6226888.1 hypothetical protein [Corynebacterium flavescens]